jgi:hypothetical protein
MAPREDFDEDVAIGEDEEDVTVDHEPSVSTSTTEQLTSASDEAVEESEMEGLSSDVEAGAESCEDQQNRKSTVNKTDTFEFEGHTLRRRPMTTVKTKAIKKEDKDLHLKASKLIPHHLPETRYWAAVLMHTIQPHKAKNEKDFIWLKGSRVSRKRQSTEEPYQQGLMLTFNNNRSTRSRPSGKSTERSLPRRDTSSCFATTRSSNLKTRWRNSTFSTTSSLSFAPL